MCTPLQPPTIPPFKLTFVFHSCFILETSDTAVVFDFFRDTTNNFVANFAYNTKKQLYFVNSHAHPDHFNKNIFKIEAPNTNVKIILSRDIRESLGDNQLSSVSHFIKLNEVYQDEHIRLTACPSTDIGLSFAIETGGVTAYHAGDNNNWYLKSEMDVETLDNMERCFLASVDKVRQGFDRFNIAMFPIDPRLEDEIYRGTKQFLDRFKVDFFVPMHLWGRYDLPGKTVSSLNEYCCKVLVNDNKEKVLINTLP